MPRPSLPLVAIAVAALLPAPGRAQAAVPIDSLRQGTEIRIWSRQPALKGWKLEYLGRTDTSLVLRERFGSVSVRNFRNEFPMSTVDRVEVKTGTRVDGNRVVTSMLKGAGIGVLAGAVTGYMLGSVSEGGDGGTEYYAAAILGELGLVVGGVGGALVGTRGATVWTQVRIP